MTGEDRAELGPDDLDYTLPVESIATHPASPRDHARLMVVRCGADDVEHAQVRDLPRYLGSPDLLVANDTRVCAARLVGRRTDTGGRVEGLFLEAISETRWRVLLRSNGRLRPGQAIELVDLREEGTGVTLTVVREPDASGRGASPWEVEVAPAAPAATWLARAGHVPLPPYIRRARRDHGEPEEVGDDQDWYQTVFARGAAESVAAPTAGLHFTPSLLAALDGAGVERTTVTLHVGPGTFAPVTAPTLAEHPMHAERWSVSGSALRLLARAAEENRRVVAVGTTAVRTLESLPPSLDASAFETGASGVTRLLIAPPYEFRRVRALLTNFHLPRSTLLALVAAMVGRERLLDLYADAVERGYRFYSYGDAMLVLP